MKTLITLMALALSLAGKAADHYPTACITNICIVVLNFDSYISYNGVRTNELCGLSYASSSGCWGNGATITIGMDECPSEDTPIGYVCFTCDETIDCAGGCAPGGATLITMSACVNQIGISIFSFWGCCSMTYCVQWMHLCGNDPAFWMQDEWWNAAESAE